MTSSGFWWVPPGTAAVPAPTESIAPRETLYFFDEPINFLARVGSDTFVCVKVDDDGTKSQYVAAHVTDEIVGRLKAGSLSLRAALVAARLWIFETDRAHLVLGAWSLDPADVPEEMLPEPGCGIWAEHGTIPEAGPSA